MELCLSLCAIIFSISYYIVVWSDKLF